MADTVEIRWHGRGGQGTKTASLLLADAAFNTGKYIQGFPEYGPERMGAPLTAYNRISDKPIRIHSNIYEPDYVVVVDESLLDTVDVAGGLKEGGGIIINTQDDIEKVRKKFDNLNCRVYSIDAKSISEDCLGRNFPNTPMLGAVVKVSGIMDTDDFINCMEDSYKHKFASKPQVIEGNMKALKRSVSEVKGI